MKEVLQSAGGRIKRRGLFALGALGAIEATLIGLSHDGVTENGVDTEKATFFPYYDLHSQGNVVPLRKDLDFFFIEGLQSQYPPDTLLEKYMFYDQPVLTDNEIQSVVKNGTSVAVGDVDLGLSPTPVGYVSKELIATGLLMLAETYAAGKIFKKAAEAKFNRRRFLKASIIGAGIWADSAVIGGLPMGLSSLLQDPHAQRISRIFGILSDLHPELSIIFFRNAVIADKLLTLAEVYQKMNGRKQKIGYNLGKGHSGIEDFLKAGLDFCTSIITKFPLPYLQQVVDNSGGLANFCTIKTVKFPPDFDPKDPNSLIKAEQTQVSDIVLYHELQKKGVKE